MGKEGKQIRFGLFFLDDGMPIVNKGPILKMVLCKVTRGETVEEMSIS